MAKKSAANKGYRKTEKKKPFLTKKEIIELIIIVAVIALAIVLFNLFYDDGFIGAKDVQSGDIVSYGSAKIKNRYFKVGEANELDGFTLTENRSENSGLINYTYTPDQETDHINNITLAGSHVDAETLTDSIIAYNSSIDSIETSEKIATTIQDHDAFVFGYTYDYYDSSLAADVSDNAEAAAPVETEAPADDAAAETTEAPADDAAAENTEAPADDAAAEDTEASADPASNVYCQNLSVYVRVDDEGHTIAMHISRTGDDDSFYMPEDQYLDYALKYTDAFTVVQNEK